MALGALRGFSYEIASFTGGPPIEATTYIDWAEATLSPGDPVETYVGHIDSALASGAHAAAFLPVRLDRSALRDVYVSGHGVKNFPASGNLWYTDGGTIDNQPLGRCLGISDDLTVALMVIPHPKLPIGSDDESWAWPDGTPSWKETAGRTISLVTAASQSAWDDLDNAQKTNSWAQWTDDHLVHALVDRLDDEPATRTALEGVLAQIAADKGKAPDPPPQDFSELVRKAVRSATGLGGKRRVHIDAISPLMLSGKPEDMLAGEFLGHFGGFLDRRLRSHDFALGYRSTMTWLKDDARGLQALGVTPDTARAACKAADDVYEANAATWETHMGAATLGSLGLRARLQVARLAARALRLTVAPGRSRRR
jgi:hypothetical protein